MHTVFFDTFLAPRNILALWKANAVLLVAMILVTIATPFLKSSVLEYPSVKGELFNGATLPIAFVPNWLDAKYSNKSIRYEDIPVADFIKTPFYDPAVLENDDPLDKIARLTRSTYITPYMGSYRMNFLEYDGSHLGVDIRAPLGTPVVSIANGVVVKVKTTENSDGKYVIIRHDNVKYDGIVDTFYSAYLHLESINAVEWTSIKKGEILGKVGLTGITTTPHLHLQIDRVSAPFHAYWPYSFADLKQANLDFFEAVNVGFGKENAMKHTVHPLDFVQSLESGNVSENTSAEVKVNSNVSAPEVSTQNIVPAVSVSSEPKKEVQISATSETLNSAPVLPLETNASKTSTENNGLGNLASQAMKGTDMVTRHDAIKTIASIFHIEGDYGMNGIGYRDIVSDDEIVPLLRAFQARGILAKTDLFRPFDAVTKSELATMMVRASGNASLNTSTSVSLKTFVSKTGYKKMFKRTNFWMNRDNVDEMVAVWKQNAM